MADPLHSTDIGNHPPFTSSGAQTVTSIPLVPVQYATIYIGRKPLSIYLQIVRRALQETGGVIISARGDLISRAILVAMKNLVSPYVLNVSVNVVPLKGEDGQTREVPTIDLTLSYPSPPVSIILS